MRVRDRNYGKVLIYEGTANKLPVLMHLLGTGTPENH
jgi:hypothetical protein